MNLCIRQNPCFSRVSPGMEPFRSSTVFLSSATVFSPCKLFPYQRVMQQELVVMRLLGAISIDRDGAMNRCYEARDLDHNRKMPVKGTFYG